MMRCGVCNIVRNAGDDILCAKLACPFRTWQRVLAGCDAGKIDPPEREKSPSKDGGARRGTPTLDRLEPALVELIKLLPPPGTAWPVAARRCWLVAFAAAADLIYGPVPLTIHVAGGEPMPADVGSAKGAS